MCAHLMRLWLGYRAAWCFRDVSRDAKGLGTSSKLRCYVGLRIVTLSKNLIKYENRYSQIFNIGYRELHATYMDFYFILVLMTRPANKVTISLPAPTRPAGYETTHASLFCGLAIYLYIYRRFAFSPARERKTMTEAEDQTSSRIFSIYIII